MSAKTSRGLRAGSLEAAAAAFVFVVVLLISSYHRKRLESSSFDVVSFSGNPVVGCRDPVAYVTLARPFVGQSAQALGRAPLSFEALV